MPQRVKNTTKKLTPDRNFCPVQIAEKRLPLPLFLPGNTRPAVKMQYDFQIAS